VYDKINLMLPTYGRAGGKLGEFISSALDMRKNRGAVCFTFVVNVNDTESRLAIKNMLDGNAEYCIIDEALSAPDLSKYFNAAYEHTIFKNEKTAVSMLGDDMVFRTKNYDEIILTWINAFNGVCVVFGNDLKGTGDSCAVNLFTTRKLVNAMSPLPFMCELFPCDDIDVIWTFVAEKLKRKFYVDNLEIFHNHATLPGNMDKTWERLRKNLPVTKSNRFPDTPRNGHVWGNSAYEDECVKNIHNNIPEEFHTDLSVIMTTKDRIDILTDTVNSYLASSQVPDKITVFDDHSEYNVIEQIKRIKNAELYISDHTRGCAANTLHALKTSFNNGAEAVLVIDSDTRFSKYWFQRAIYLRKYMQKNNSIAAASLFNDALKESEPLDYSLVKKLGIGAFGSIISKEYFNKYVLPQNPKTNWDYIASLNAIKDNKIICASSPSFLQHTGTEGTHSNNEKFSVAVDFHGNPELKKPKRITKSKNTLYAIMGRYGDIILSSMIANMLIEKNYNITWLTIPKYKPLISLLSKNRIIVKPAPQEESWGSTTTSKMAKNYPGFDFYINAQPGCHENHAKLFKSGIPMYQFCKSISENATGETLPDNYIDYLTFFGKPITLNKNQLNDKPLGLISTKVISIPNAISEDELNNIYKKYKTHNLKTLVESRPHGVPIKMAREKYLWGYSFEECVSMMNLADLFIGNDSGLAWASLVNKNCKRIIYHNENRIIETNNLYGKIAPNTTDIIVSK
jgi:hypothetical protein